MTSEIRETDPRRRATIAAMDLDRIACCRAVEARDPRFDGRFFTAVRTTGVYCRPICPARTPKLENVAFFATAAAAQAAGYRPCLRCRPETAPDLAAGQGRSRTVARALALIGSGALDGDVSLPVLATRLGIGDRHLRRLFREQLGASPIEVAQTRRVLFAKQLIHETTMSMVDVALAAGFGSVRRFNETFRCLYGRPPSELRRSGQGKEPAAAGSAITLTLGYDPPYDWQSMIAFLAARAIDGVEVVAADRYRRTVEIGGRHGTLEVAPIAGRPALAATIRFPDVRALPEIVARVRRVFDLASDARAITARLGRDPLLGPLVDARPGLRVPGAWDGFESAVRAILGQQVTVTAARVLAGRLVATYGGPVAGEPGLAATFPRPERLGDAAEGIAALGMPGSRARSIAALAAAFSADPAFLERDLDPAQTVARLMALPGVGPWTAQYVALRALRDPDAFPASDVGLLRAATTPGGTRPTPAALLARAEAWRPWRAYAAQLLWTAPPEPASRAPGAPVRAEAVA